MKVGKRKGLFVEFVAVLKTHEIQLMNQLDQILDGAFSTEQVGKWMNDLLLRDANKPVYGRRFGDLYDVEEQWDRISIYRLKRDGTHASLLFRACLSGLEKVLKNEGV